MKPAATVCTLTLLLAAPLASQCPAAALPQQGRDRVATRWEKIRSALLSSTSVRAPAETPVAAVALG